MLSGPIDEVGDDQEVAGEAHLDDRLDLERQPLLVAHGLAPALGRIGKQALEPPPEPARGLLRQMLVDRYAGGRRKLGQAILAQPDLEIAAARDLARVLERLRHIGEKARHLLRRLEILLG
jgi:hypothetical protein